jgi:hypothetical protein
MHVLHNAPYSPDTGSLSAQWWNDSRSLFLFDMLALMGFLQGPSMGAWCCKGRAGHHVHARPVGVSPVSWQPSWDNVMQGPRQGFGPRSNQDTLLRTGKACDHLWPQL